MKKKKSRARKAGYITAWIALTGCIFAIFITSICVAFGIYTLSTDKMIALLIIMIYLCSRAGRK